MIRIENLTKVYSDGGVETRVLNDVSIHIKRGDIYGIIGLSGAGKSTLVRCINMLERPTSGKIFIGDDEITCLSGKKLAKARRKVAMIFQQFNLLQQRTVVKNVELAGEIVGDKNRRKKAEELLEAVGLKDKMNCYPSQLSGGQQQRVAIARALMTDPDVLLCDEGTSALDPETTASILKLFKQLNTERGLTIVIISHSMPLIETVCNKVAVIDSASIVAEGDINEIFLSASNPAVKKLVYSGHIAAGGGENLIKLMFRGDIERPLISDIVKQLGISLSLLYGESKEFDGKYYGQIIFGLPEYDRDIHTLRKYLVDKNISFEEVRADEFN